MEELFDSDAVIDQLQHENERLRVRIVKMQYEDRATLPTLEDISVWLSDYAWLISLIGTVIAVFIMVINTVIEARNVHHA